MIPAVSTERKPGESDEFAAISDRRLYTEAAIAHLCDRLSVDPHTLPDPLDTDAAVRQIVATRALLRALAADTPDPARAEVLHDAAGLFREAELHLRAPLEVPA